MMEVSVMIKNPLHKWLVLLIAATWILVGYSPVSSFATGSITADAREKSASLSMPRLQEQPQQTPQIILALDVSRSMGSLVLPGELPADLAALRARVEQVEHNPEYMRLSRELHSILADPAVETAYQAWSEASTAVDNWLSANGYGENQFVIADYVAALLADSGCDASYDAFIAYSAGSLAEIDEKLTMACAGVTLNQAQRQAIKDVVAYMEKQDYQALRAAETERFAAYTKARDALNYQEVREQFNAARDKQDYGQAQAEFEAQAKAAGIPSRLDLVKRATQALLDLSRLDRLAGGGESPVGVVDFSNSANLLQPLTTDYGLVETEIDTLQPLYETNISAGLNTALAELARDGQPNQPATIILFTDGQNNVGVSAEQILAQVPGQAETMNVSICTVGFGNQESDIDAGFMRNLAETTGGQYLFATTAEELVSFFIACRQGMVTHLADQLAGVARQGETVEAGRIEVREGIGELTLTFNYLQGRLSIELIDSQGNVIDSSYPGVTVEPSASGQTVTITHPRPGEWTVRVAANEAPPDGVVFNILINTQANPTPTPTPAELPATLTPPPLNTSTAAPPPSPVSSSPSALDQMSIYLAGGAVLLGTILAVGGGVWAYRYLKRGREN
jgi:uncharacterized membrane protein